jgi:RHS repeat-associated protein
MVGTGVYYLHQDALGSTRLVTSSSIMAIFRSNYIPYGIKYAAVGKEEFTYTGKPYDTATGLYYYGARYYDPNTGRFISQDSYPGNRTDPMTMDLYVYARDNPERYVDSNGHRLLSTNALYGGGPQYIPPPTDTSSSTTMTWTDYQKKHVWASTTTAPTPTTGIESYTATTPASTNTSPISGPNPTQTTSQSCVWVPVIVIGIGLPGVDSRVPSGFWGWAFFVETNFGPVNFPFAIGAVPIGDCAQPNIDSTPL